MKAQSRDNIICYCALVLLLVIVHFVIYLNPDISMLQSQRAMFSWPAIGVLGSLGFLSVVLLNFTKLKGLWDVNVGINRKIIFPLLIGLLAGVILSIYDLSTGVTSLISASMGVENIHIAFPYSIPTYLGGAVIVSILYYLILISIVVFIVSSKILKGKGESIVFWSIAIPVAFIEPLTNPGIAIIIKLGATAAFLSVFSLFINLLSVWLIRKYGFISEIFLRIGFYIIFHILYPVI